MTQYVRRTRTETSRGQRTGCNWRTHQDDQTCVPCTNAVFSVRYTLRVLDS